MGLTLGLFTMFLLNQLNSKPNHTYDVKLLLDNPGEGGNVVMISEETYRRTCLYEAIKSLMNVFCNPWSS